MAINMDAEELVVQSAVSPKAVIVDEEEETLQESLVAKVESGEGNSRLQRRMQRKQQRELVEMTEQMINNIPHLSPQPRLLLMQYCRFPYCPTCHHLWMRFSLVCRYQICLCLKKRQIAQNVQRSSRLRI